MELPDLVERLAQIALAAGIVTIVLKVVNRASERAGWAGIWVAVAGGVAIWAESTALAAIALGVGVAAAVYLLVPRARSSGSRLVGAIRARSFEPWDHEAALLRLCHGDKAQMERLIEFEQRKNPELSRAGAALAAATRLRHDRK